MFQSFYSVRLHPNIEGQPLHRLHVAIAAEKTSALIPNTILGEVGCQFNGILCSSTAAPRGKNIFVTVHALRINLPDEDNETIALYVTKDFLSHYHFEYGQTLQFKRVQCAHLSKVVFISLSEHTYKWAKSDNWQRDLLLCLNETNIVCRLHDVFLANPRYFSNNDSALFMGLRTIICEPIEQGILTADTNVIIFRDQKIQKTSLHFQSYVNLEKKFIAQNFEKTIDSSSIKLDHMSLEIQIIPHFKMYFSESFCEFDDFENFDPLNTIFVTFNTLNYLDIKPGIVKVKLASLDRNQTNSSEQTNKSRSVWLVSTFKEFNTLLLDRKAYMSPNLWFNLNSHPSRLIQPARILKVLGNSDSLSYAKEVFVSLVQSPCYHGAINCDNMLKKYFQIPRLVYKGDIICIDTKDAVEFKQKSQGIHADNIASVVYFRVSMIEDPPSDTSDNGYLIDHDHTRLYHAGTTQNYIPMTVETFYSSYSTPVFYGSPSPPGLQHYVDVLQMKIEPLLNVESRKKCQVNSNIIITGPTGCGKTVIVRSLCKCLNLHLYQVNCYELLGDNSATIEARLRIIIEKASTYSPCILLLKNIDIIGKERELKGENSRVVSCSMELLRDISQCKYELPVIIIATTVHSKLISSNLLTAFLHVINIDPPTDQERVDILEGLLHPSLISDDVSLDYLAQRTAGFVLADLSHLVLEAGKNSYLRLRELTKDDGNFEEDVILAGFPVIQQDFLGALDQMHHDHAQSSGTPQIPNVNWEDIGGLEDVKQQILDSIKLPLDYPEILSTGLKRSGVLLYGPPGSGKTLLAKAVASEFSLNFLNIKGPELINMYVGQSEENVRAVFAQARIASPCIIFFDELDSLAPKRGRSGDSGGVMDRVVSQLLSEIDGLHTSSLVFVIGATNRPDLLDPALLRPGRFDQLVFVGIPNDKLSRLSVLKALTRKLNLARDVNLERIVDLCPLNMSGADFYSLCSDAVMNRIESNVKLIESGQQSIEESSMVVTEQDFAASIHKLLPSVNVDELSRYRKFMEKT